MFVTLLPAKALVTLALAAVLAVIAVALLGVSIAHRSSARTATILAGASTSFARATPGSTAHARHQYRLSLQR